MATHMNSESETFDLMSSDHFLVVLHPDKEHALIFNRLDNTIATINYDDAKELSNLKYICKVYGIVGKFLNKYLVVIRTRSFRGILYEPKTRTEHKIYVITQVDAIDLSKTTSFSEEQPKDNRYAERDTEFGATNLQSGLVGAGQTVEFKDSSDSSDKFSSLPVTISSNSYVSAQNPNPWNPFKIANSLRPKTSQFLKMALIEPILANDPNSSKTNQEHQQQQNQFLQDSNNSTVTDHDERRLVEMIKLFRNTNSFYYSPTLDLTNRFSQDRPLKRSELMWETADERFFWNRHMLKDLIELSDQDYNFNYFICVILHGFIAIEDHHIASGRVMSSSDVESALPATVINQYTSTSSFESETYDKLMSGNRQHFKTRPMSSRNLSIQEKLVSKNYQLALISRRSVFYAGCRYLRRGCDEHGNCANFVETEQVFRHKNHFTSLVIIRGSIPLFWYQTTTGLNYKRDPILFGSEEENHEAFTRHFQDLFRSYETENIIIVDCTEHHGREKALHEAYKRHLGKYQQFKPKVKLIEFDYHKLCPRSPDFEIERQLRNCGLDESAMRSVKYYWHDSNLVCKQEGVIRVNCLDCSDRTNVVQRAIALQVLDTQLARLGILAPDTCNEDNEIRLIMKKIWSDNGDVLSTQYCGTGALLKSEKKIDQIRDLRNSIDRYYQGNFRDADRQAAIDAMLGVDDKNLGIMSMRNERPSQMDPSMSSLDSRFLPAQSGKALLRDVGSRVRSRISALSGKLHTKTSGLDELSMASRDIEDVSDRQDMDFVDVRVNDKLDELNIDWPSSESVENSNESTTTPRKTSVVVSTGNSGSGGVFAQFTSADDCYQDDEFGQLMLSIDLAELQRLREVETGKDKSEKDSEQIDMTEARGIRTVEEKSGDKATFTTET